MQIDAHEIRGSDFLEHQSIRIDQKIVTARHARRDVREDQIIPAEVRDQPIAGGEIDAGRPLLGRHLIADIERDVVDDAHLHGDTPQEGTGTRD